MVPVGGLAGRQVATRGPAPIATWAPVTGARPAAGRYGVTVTTENMPALKWPGMLQTKR
jgi:hypothetical protein